MFSVSITDLLSYFVHQISSVVNAEYELEYLLLEGHCFDLSTGQPPRGLQFTLGMRQEPLMHDTIVMANLVSLSLFLAFSKYILYFSFVKSLKGIFLVLRGPKMRIIS